MVLQSGRSSFIAQFWVLWSDFLRFCASTRLDSGRCGSLLDRSCMPLANAFQQAMVRLTHVSNIP
eukprot:m.1459385 g.1459385  ORF g.1459385 m.1459385 type:complete len:65 (-) comp25126_c0_seq20:388-582(-)